MALADPWSDSLLSLSPIFQKSGMVVLVALSLVVGQ